MNEIFPDLVEEETADLFKKELVLGRCYVMTFTPKHSLTMADLSTEDLIAVIRNWTILYSRYVDPMSSHANALRSSYQYTFPEISGNTSSTQYKHMQIFENKGAAAGCSNNHPHCQIWITSSLPEEPAIELTRFISYTRSTNGKHLLQNYAHLEASKNERVVFANRTFLAICPYWGTWPFEIIVIPKYHKRSLIDLQEDEYYDLAQTMSQVTRTYDKLFNAPFTYNMGIHQAPLAGSSEEIESSYLHIHFYPPLYNDITKRKFFGG